MALATLSNIVIDPTQTGATGVVVRAQLIASSGFLADASAEVITYAQTTTDDNGVWSLQLTPEDLLEDPGAYYQITEGRRQWFVTIPIAGTYTLRPQIINPPISTAGGGGVAGNQFLSGTTVPTAFLGIDGDSYLRQDATHADLYLKTAGAWHLSRSLIGPAGGVSSFNTLTGALTIGPAQLSPAGVAATDSRLTDARTPTGHHTSHEAGGTDPVNLAAIGSPDLTLRPINARDQANPLMNAVMDGGSHLVSSRFGTLAAAQAVFGASVALGDELDFWAIQSALSTAGATKVDLGWGTAVVNKTLLIAAGGNQTITGEGTGATTIQLKSGSNVDTIACADQTNVNTGITLRGFSVNGNAAGNTGPIGQTDGIFLYRPQKLRLENIEVYGVNGRGIHSQGLTGTVVEGQSWRDINCHDNLHWGIWNTNGVREVSYVDVTCVGNGFRTDLSLTHTGNAADNFTGGFLMDHSEASLVGVQCHLNAQDGLWIRNAFDCSIVDLRTTQNGRHGVRVLGLVDSACASWLSQGNGQNSSLASASYDIWFDGTSSLNYGITARTRFDGITAGPSASATIATQGSWTSPEAWAIFFDDAMTGSDAEIHAKVYPGTAGDVRFPTAGIGTMLFGQGPSGLDKVANNLTSGTTYALPDVNVATMHRVVLTASCAITIPPAAAGKVIAVSLVQDGTGSRTVTWSAASGSIKWAGGGTPPTLTTNPGGADLVAFECFDGAHWIGTVVGQNI